MALLANGVNTGFPSSSSRFTSWSGAPSAGRGLINKSTGVHREASESSTSHYPPQVWNFPRNLPQSFQNNFNINGGGRNFQMPFLSSAGQQKHPSVNGFGDVDVQRQTFASKGSSLNQQNQAHTAGLRPPFLMRQEVPQYLVPPASISTPSHLVLPFLSNGYGPQGHGCTFANNSMQSSQPIPSTSMHLPGAAQPPLPPGPDLLAGGALSGLLTSLMAQGVISLTNQAPVQDLVGLEFSSEFLKVRHESVINALYADLPRQCKSCGARFKSQEDHRRHMDWHVEKNRKSKDRKRMQPSRNWLTSVEVWLHGMEEAVNNAFLSPSVNVVEEKDYDKIVVPADEDQKVCALCGELFVYFYSDETEEWMYKDAVYKNAPPSFGCTTADMDRSKLGPIVHAKCRGESGVVTSDDFCKNETGCTEDDRQRKRMRLAY